MPLFTVGETEIPYEVKESARAKRMRLTLLPEKFRVTAPKDSDAASIEGFLRQNEKWVCSRWQELAENPPFNPWPERFEPGAKVFFNGRWEKIVSVTRVKSTACSIEICPTGFSISKGVGSDEASVRSAFVSFSAEFQKRTGR